MEKDSIDSINNDTLQHEDYYDYLQNKYIKLVRYFKKIDKMNRMEFERFCCICEWNLSQWKDDFYDFLWTSNEKEKEIIKELIIKKLDSKEKYFHLKILRLFINDKELDNEILKFMKNNIPNDEERFILNTILQELKEPKINFKIQKILNNPNLQENINDKKKYYYKNIEDEDFNPTYRDIIYW